jgi:two-component system nitrogen regulation response regulator GlnG
MHSQNKSLSILSECTGFAGKRQGYNRKNFIWNVAPLPVAKPLLLIVDDDSLISESLSFAFAQEYDVLTSHSRSHARSLVRQLRNPPRLALVDLGLPPCRIAPTKVSH